MRTAPAEKRQWGLAFKLGSLMILGTSLIFGAVFTYQYVNNVEILFQNASENARNLTLSTLNKIEAVLKSVEKTPAFLAAVLENSELSGERELMDLGANAVAANPEIYGSMFAFEPFSFDKSRQYFGPYHFREKKLIKTTWLGNENYNYFNLDWYALPRELGRPVWTEPYMDEGGTDLLLSTFSVPYCHKKGGKRVFWGVVTADITLDWLEKIVDSVKVLRTGYAFLVSQNGVFVTHPDKQLVMRASIFDQAEELGDPELRRLGRDMIHGGTGFHPFTCGMLKKKCWMYYAPIHTTGWSLVVVFPADELFGDLRSLTRRGVEMGLLGFACLFFLAIYTMRKLVRPIARITGLADRIAAGDLRASSLHMELFEQDAARLTTREYSRLARSFISMTRSLISLIGHVRESGVQVSETSSEISASARQLEVTAAEQAAATQEVSTTSRTISDRTQLLARTMGEVTDVAANTSTLASQGRNGLERMEEGMLSLVTASTTVSSRLGAISEKAEKIGSIIKTINKVADQTNLLSLNAGIEAEKAGEYGLGFSVVAREIRRLADQTAIATRDIRRMVEEMLAAVSSGVMEMDKFVEQVKQGGEEVRSINGQLGGIIEQVRMLPPRFESISQEMQAQSHGATQISEAMVQLSAAADQIRNSMREFNRVTEHLNSAARNLGQEVSNFKVDA
ncbi:MAG: methyl-accepting chemotaxis protein [Lentisphaerota bacterium]